MGAWGGSQRRISLDCFGELGIEGRKLEESLGGIGGEKCLNLLGCSEDVGIDGVKELLFLSNEVMSFGVCDLGGGETQDSGVRVVVGGCGANPRGVCDDGDGDVDGRGHRV